MIISDEKSLHACYLSKKKESFKEMSENRKVSELITEMNMMMDGNRSMTVESLMFGDKAPAPVQVPQSKPEGQPQQPAPAQGGQVTKQSPQPAPEDAEVLETINQIRVLALQGVAKLAQHPESPYYDICKRIWTMCDKNVETAKTTTTQTQQQAGGQQ